MRPLMLRRKLKVRKRKLKERQVRKVKRVRMRQYERSHLIRNLSEKLRARKIVTMMTNLKMTKLRS